MFGINKHINRLSCLKLKLERQPTMIDITDCWQGGRGSSLSSTARHSVNKSSKTKHPCGEGRNVKKTKNLSVNNS